MVSFFFFYKNILRLHVNTASCTGYFINALFLKKIKFLPLFELKNSKILKNAKLTQILYKKKSLLKHNMHVFKHAQSQQHVFLL